MKPTPTRQRRQAHRQRKALGRVRHQLRAMRTRWMGAWNRYQRRAGPKPRRIKLPYIVRAHKKSLYRLWVRA